MTALGGQAFGAMLSPGTHTCRVAIRGNAAGVSTPPQASIHCWTPEDSHRCSVAPGRSADQSQLQHPSASGPNQPLTVWVSAALCSALTAATSRPTDATLASEHLEHVEAPTCGVELRLRSVDPSGSASPPPDWQQDGRSARALHTHAGTPPYDVGAPPPHHFIDPDIPDWGVSFRGVPHLVLVDSVLTHLPLSPHGPLLQCAGCQHLTIANLTMRNLAGPSAAGPESPLVHGALHASGLGSVQALQVHCTDVKRAHGWACMLLQYARAQDASGAGEGEASSSGGNSSFTVQDSTLRRNEVVQAAPGQNAEGLGQLGMGAVVLAADDSWVLDPSPAAAAAEPAGQQPTAEPAAPQQQSGTQRHPTAPAPPLTARALVPQPLSMAHVELHGVVAEGNKGGSGALLALLDLRVASVRLMRCSLIKNSAFRGGVVYAGSSDNRLSGGVNSSRRSSTSGVGGGVGGAGGSHSDNNTQQGDGSANVVEEVQLGDTVLRPNSACFGGVLSVAGHLGRLSAANSTFYENGAVRSEDMMSR